MVYDCFPFFNELDLLEIRLNTLNNVVDKFILVEATETFQGKRKPLYFKENKKRFEKFLDKIIYVSCEFPQKTQSSSWEREYYQRNKIVAGLLNATNDDWIILSDIDEIPSPPLHRRS